MRDVAEPAGVSLKTVSRVINAEAGVAAATAERVDAAIAALGFQRNDLAALAAPRPLLLDARPRHRGRRQPVLLGGRPGGRGGRARARLPAHHRLRPRGRRARARARRRAAAAPRRRAADRPRRPRPPLHRRRRRARVFLDRPPRGIEADTVLLDDLGGARSAVEHLIAHGHTRIACVADDAEPLHGARAPRRLPRGARGRRASTRTPSLLVTGNQRRAAAQAAVDAPARAARRAARPRSSPPTTATRSARCTRSPTRRGRSRSSASTTSSSPTCSAPPSCAPTRGSSASRAPSSRSPASTATTRPPRTVTDPDRARRPRLGESA